MTPIITKLANALIAAGYRHSDGRINTYAAEKAGICDSGWLCRVLSGQREPSIEAVDEVLGRIGCELTIRRKRKSS